MSIENAVNKLIAAFEKIESRDSGLHDTVVREILRETIKIGLREPVSVYEFSSNFSMYSEEDNVLVHDALMEFLNHPSIAAIRLGKETRDRLVAVCWEGDVELGSTREGILLLLGLSD